MSDLPPSAAAPPDDDVRTQFQEERTHVWYAFKAVYTKGHLDCTDDPEIPKLALDRLVRAVRAASREGGSSPDPTDDELEAIYMAAYRDNRTGPDDANDAHAEGLLAVYKSGLAASRERAAALPPTDALRDAQMIVGGVWDSESLTATSPEYEAGWNAACKAITEALRAAAPQQEERTPPKGENG